MKYYWVKDRLYGQLALVYEENYNFYYCKFSPESWGCITNIDEMIKFFNEIYIDDSRCIKNFNETYKIISYFNSLDDYKDKYPELFI